MGMEGFAVRLRKAFRALEDRLGRDLTQTELGELVGKQLGEDAITQQSVARWFAGTLPEHVRMVALAKVLGVDPGWLSYGSGGDEGEQGAKPTNGNPRPRHPIVETKVQYLDPRVPTQPNRAKPKDAPKKPGRSAVA